MAVGMLESRRRVRNASEYLSIFPTMNLSAISRTDHQSTWHCDPELKVSTDEGRQSVMALTHAILAAGTSNPNDASTPSRVQR